jgi:hypothetical protein
MDMDTDEYSTTGRGIEKGEYQGNIDSVSLARGKGMTKSEHTQRYKTPRQADIGAVAQREEGEIKPMTSFGRGGVTQ